MYDIHVARVASNSRVLWATPKPREGNTAMTFAIPLPHSLWVLYVNQICPDYFTLVRLFLAIAYSIFKPLVDRFQLLLLTEDITVSGTHRC